jgi:hypothetical protein
MREMIEVWKRLLRSLGDALGEVIAPAPQPEPIPVPVPVDRGPR